MRVFVISLVLLIIMGSFIGIHAYVMQHMAGEISDKCEGIDELAHAGQWDEILDRLDDVRNIWEDHRMWASLTISTKEIEQIEISLKQSTEYAKLGEKSDFIGEYIMFYMLVDHIPHKEGFHIEEIL